MKLHVVYATDENYLAATLVAASSALFHASNKSQVCVDIIDCGVSDEKWAWFADHLKGLGGEFRRHRVETRTFDKLRCYHGSKGAYARLLIPDVLSDISWCVYCDGDTLFTADPLLLCDIFDDHYWIQGHLDHYGPSKPWFQKNGLEWPEGRYVCSGFIIMNLNEFRENRIGEECIRFLSDHVDAPFADQEALNALCAGKVGLLPAEWGCFSYEAMLLDGTSPKLIHYVLERPWELPNDRRVFLPDTSRLWFRYAKYVARINFSDLSRASRLRYATLYCLACIAKLAYRSLSLIPALRERYATANSRFFRKQWWRKMTQAVQGD